MREKVAMIKSEKELRKNGSGYDDPTAYQAIKNISAEEMRFKKFIKTIRYICELSGFTLEHHIIVRDQQTGKVCK